MSADGKLKGTHPLTFVRPTQPVEIYRNVSSSFGTN